VYVVWVRRYNLKNPATCEAVGAPFELEILRSAASAAGTCNLQADVVLYSGLAHMGLGPAKSMTLPLFFFSARAHDTSRQPGIHSHKLVQARAVESFLVPF
jgi:hypothetical protein